MKSAGGDKPIVATLEVTGKSKTKEGLPKESGKLKPR